MSEYVYVLTNQAFLDFVKIGRTSRPIDERVKELSGHAGVPIPFECFCCFKFPKGRSKVVEKGIHKVLENCRVVSKKEFFKINPVNVKILLESYSDGKRIVLKDEDIVANEEEQRSLDKQRAIRERFNFLTTLKLKKGAVITFDKNPKKTATVTGSREIEYNGKKGLLGTITKDILKRDFSLNWKTCRGSDHWSYKGENLTDRRMRIEEGTTAPTMK